MIIKPEGDDVGSVLASVVVNVVGADVVRVDVVGVDVVDSVVGTIYMYWI